MSMLKLTLKQRASETLAIRQTLHVQGLELEQAVVAYRQGMTVGFVAFGSFSVDIDQFRGLVETAISRA